MTKIPERIEVPLSPDRTRNRRIRARPGADDECLLCGRPIVSARATWVHLTDGKLASRDEGVEVSDAAVVAGDQGFWPVGPECARRVPARFRFKRTEWEVTR